MNRIEVRRRMIVNTDPLRRCYDGHHFSSKTIWTNWEELESGIPDEKISRRLEFWKELNAEAVKEGGSIAKRQFRAIK